MATALPTAEARAAEEILASLSEVVLHIGRVLDVVYRTTDVAEFDEWVEENLPIQPRTAERVRAMWLIHSEHPSVELPEPWKALWSID
jgi:hypothetical protein